MKIYEYQLYLDINDLRDRGWTEALISRFLGAADRWVPVSHWLNWTGKRQWFLGQIETAEHDEEFQIAFERSALRRKLPREEILEMLERRRSTEGWVDTWQQSLTENDLSMMHLAEQVRQTFKQIRGPLPVKDSVD